MPLRFPFSELGLGRPRDTVYTDPRDGSPADEYTRFVEAQQLLWTVLPAVLNLYPTGNTINAVACEDLCKFGVNYAVKAGGAYRWFHPTYVWDISRQLMQPVGFESAAFPLLPAPGTGSTIGQLNQLPHSPLTVDQAAALDAHAQVHDQQAQATIAGDLQAAAALAPQVAATLDYFVSLARNVAEQQLFDLVFTGDISPDLTHAELVAQTEGIIADHMAWHNALMAYDVAVTQLAGWSHNMRHMCRAMNANARAKWRGRHYSTTYTYKTVSAAQLAATSGGGFRP